MRLGERGVNSSAPLFTDSARDSRIFACAAPVARGLRLPAAESGRLICEAVPMRIETWTPERVEQLRHFVVNGLSCSQIATEIGVTRNAVIGKIHRLGLCPVRAPGGSGRPCSPRSPRERAATRRPLLQILFCAGARVAEATVTGPVQSAQPRSLLELAKGQCRWPLSEAAGDCGADLVFCGNEVIAGVSYCAGHARIAYRLAAHRRA
jgi:GcrA cell cycle regulator